MTTPAGTIPRPPQLRGLLHSSIKRNLTVAITLSIIGFVGLKFAVNEPRKKAYADFYRTYDAEKDFEIMRQKGLFQSCK